MANNTLKEEKNLSKCSSFDFLNIRSPLICFKPANPFSLNKSYTDFIPKGLTHVTQYVLVYISCLSLNIYNTYFKIKH